MRTESDNMGVRFTNNKEVLVDVPKKTLRDGYVIPNVVKTIDKRAFKKCVGLKTIEIPPSVIKIGDEAFAGCAGLKSITIPSSVTTIGKDAFKGCHGLKAVTLCDGLISLGDGMFDDCPRLAFVEIPKSVAHVSNNAFANCIGLASVTIPDTIESIGASAFAGCGHLASVTIPARVKSIGENAFSGCSSLTSVTIPDTVESIGASAFADCGQLASVTISARVKSIGENAFSGCSSLTSVTIPDTVESIGASAFAGCSHLASVAIPAGIKSIGENAFSRCSSLTSVTIPHSVDNVSSSAFYNCSAITSFYVDTDNPNYASANGLLLSKDGQTLIIGINGNAIIPESVTRICDGAFYGCTNLASVVIPESVTSIGNSAFYGCSNLASVVIPSSVTSIGNSAFYGCSNLASVVIPSSVTSIGDSAFFGCSNLASVVIPGSVEGIRERTFLGCERLSSVKIAIGVKTISDYAFQHCSDLVSIRIPDSVTRIGEEAFWGCKKLAEVEMGNSVRRIGARAFGACRSLRSIAIPDSVEEVCPEAFCECPQLRKAFIPEKLMENWPCFIRGGTGFSIFANPKPTEEEKMNHTTWNAADWLVKFRDTSESAKMEGRHGASSATLKTLRKLVFENTVAAVKAGSYEPSYTWFKNAANPNPTVQLVLSPTIAADTRFYKTEIKGSWGNGGKTAVTVLEGDTLAVARLVAQTEPETAVLNMASDYQPGGGVFGGAGAQEEYLFRCSDYFRSLYQYASTFDPARYGVVRAADSYPLNGDFGGVFSQGVTVFRGPEEEGYPLLDKPWKVNFIAVAGPRGVHGADPNSPAGQNLRNKIRTILSIAAENGQRKLVLGAIGCGAFRCGATVVATVFRDAINSAEFAGAFDHIFFAIKPDHNDPDGNNIREFANVFG